MTHFISILLTLDGSPEAVKGAGCALWLAKSLGATLHVLHTTTHPLSPGDALARLGVPDARDARVFVHQPSGGAVAAVLQEIADHRIDLVVMTARGESACADAALAKRLGSVAKAVLERSPVPVVLLPARYRESLPWTSMLAASSGEASADLALRTAARLATALGLKVTVVHSQDDRAASGRPPLGSYADALVHECPPRLNQMVERGLAGGAPGDADCVHEILLRTGDAGSVLLEQVARHGSSVVALGWHGAFGGGRALVLKRLLDEAQCALLLVRGTEQAGTRLKVGSDIDAR
jgi:nucleotide-binding universal stress UspA family protein